jgi:hypothetical protein
MWELPLVLDFTEITNETPEQNNYEIFVGCQLQTWRYREL